MRVRPLRRLLESALPLLPRPLPPNLEKIEIALVDRATMARLHAEFLGQPDETDVITFPYGEIVVCPAVAREQAPRFGLETGQEILLYAIHGLLHLAGYDDRTQKKAREMERVQRRILQGLIRPPA
ncbi:MAG TPA: rRNA maturation RNase YbeY [Candidatus Methylacidiphilales bacterium]|nr:rRNA maturation RNase YbeY [Candidatus Methylacidiphilales bacterium]